MDTLEYLGLSREFVLGDIGLIYAVLERGVLDACGVVFGSEKEQKQRDKDNAKWWLFDWKDGDEKIPFSFPWICIELDLDPAEKRQTIRKLVSESDTSEAPSRTIQVKKRRYVVGSSILAGAETATEEEVYFL